ncbi:MAG TPA: ROK family transcriptional regulator [Acidimicrobiia bacterium]|nr:ROK family transcriptional regulator [Acidimicrobiia bacterium]
MRRFQQKGSAVSRISDAGRRGVATEELRRHNLSAVLERLHLGGPLTRSDLASQTGLNRSTIRDLITELRSLGLVVESPGTPSTGPGRPSSVARVSGRGAVVVAVELEVDSIAVATIGLGGRIFTETREAIPKRNPQPEELVAQLADLAAPLIAELPEDASPVGVGVGVAGVVRRSDGFIHVAPNLGWRDVPIARLIQDTLGFDLVKVANEADMGALGEYRRGAAVNSRDMIFVAGEVGVGIGIIHDSAPMLGLSGYAGEAGHMLINPRGVECRCGAVGCWETEVGEEALARRAGIDLGDGAAPISEIVRRADDGHVGTRTALWELGRWLGIGIGNLVNILNPDLVVVGGFYQQLYPYIAGAIELGAKEVALEAPWAACSIALSELGQSSVLIGAAELVHGDLIADPLLLVEELATTP